MTPEPAWLQRRKRIVVVVTHDERPRSDLSDSPNCVGENVRTPIEKHHIWPFSFDEFHYVAVELRDERAEEILVLCLIERQKKRREPAFRLEVLVPAETNGIMTQCRQRTKGRLLVQLRMPIAEDKEFHFLSPVYTVPRTGVCPIFRLIQANSFPKRRCPNNR